MEHILKNKAPAQLTAWIDNGREAGLNLAIDTPVSYFSRAPSLPAGNSRLVVLRKTVAT